jgi:hypothetical protein
MKVDPPLSAINGPGGHRRDWLCPGARARVSPGPHQVEGKYLGRGDKTKRYLSDVEGACSSATATSGPPAPIRSLPSSWQGIRSRPQTGIYPHLLIVGQPVSHNTEMCRDLVRGSGFAVRAPNLVSKVTSGAGCETSPLLRIGVLSPAPELRHLADGAFMTAVGVV